MSATNIDNPLQIIDEKIKKIYEQLEDIKLNSQQNKLVDYILKNPTKTYKQCAKDCAYKGVNVIADGTPSRTVLNLRMDLQNLYAQRTGIITKDEIIKRLKDIADEGAKDRVNALALMAKVAGLEAPIRTENKVEVKQINVIFEEDNV